MNAPVVNGTTYWILFWTSAGTWYFSLHDSSTVGGTKDTTSEASLVTPWPGTVGNFTGRATVAGVLAGIVAAIPDLHANVQDIFGHGDEVIVRLVVTGTQEGPLLGIPATGRHLQWDAIDLYRLKGGQISQEWASEDLTAILNDTGTYKAPWIP